MNDRLARYCRGCGEKLSCELYCTCLEQKIQLSDTFSYDEIQKFKDFDPNWMEGTLEALGCKTIDQALKKFNLEIVKKPTDKSGNEK